jgi:hypothetical protein
VGFASNAFPAYYYANGVDLDSAYVSKEGSLTAALSAGYQLRVHRRFSLAIEVSGMRSRGEDSSGERTVVGIQVVPLLDF